MKNYCYEKIEGSDWIKPLSPTILQGLNLYFRCRWTSAYSLLIFTCNSTEERPLLYLHFWWASATSPYPQPNESSLHYPLKYESVLFIILHGGILFMPKQVHLRWDFPTKFLYTCITYLDTKKFDFHFILFVTKIFGRYDTVSWLTNTCNLCSSHFTPKWNLQKCSVCQLSTFWKVEWYTFKLKCNKNFHSLSWTSLLHVRVMSRDTGIQNGAPQKRDLRFRN